MIGIGFLGAEDGDDGPFAICNGAGWTTFIEWVSRLSDPVPILRALVERGSVKDSASLSAQLQLAVDKTGKEPYGSSAKEGAGNDTGRRIANRMLGFVGAGDTEETVVLEEC